MEEFTRECLEVDREINGENTQKQSLFSVTSMEQIYDRAARLVKRTLDVEGAVVMDVSHVDVLENVAAESSTSITIHKDDPQLGPEVRLLTAEEYTRMQDFFSKYTSGGLYDAVRYSFFRFLRDFCLVMSFLGI